MRPIKKKLIKLNKSRNLLKFVLVLLSASKRDRKHDTLVVIDDYNFYDRHTERQKWRLYDRPGPEGVVGENRKVSKYIFKKILQR